MAETDPLISGETEVVDEDPNAVSGATNDGPTPDGEHVVVDPNAVSGSTNDGPTPDGETEVVDEDPNAVSGATNDGPTPDGEHVVVDPNAVSGATNDDRTPDGEHVVVDLTAVSGATPSIVRSSEIRVTEVPLLQHQSLGDETTMAETDLTLISGATPSIVRSSPSEISVTEQHQSLQDETTMAETDLTLISGATPSTVRSPEISVTEVPLLQQQTLRDESTMKQWENLMIRCHEVIALLIGFALMFAPIGSIIKALRSEEGQVHPISILKIITIILRNLEIHVVFPFLVSALAYALLYILSSSSAIPVACVLWMGALSVIVGFISLFVVISYISSQLCIFGGILCGSVIVVLFWKQFPRERVVIRDVERP